MDERVVVVQAGEQRREMLNVSLGDDRSLGTIELICPTCGAAVLADRMPEDGRAEHRELEQCLWCAKHEED